MFQVYQAMLSGAFICLLAIAPLWGQSKTQKAHVHGKANLSIAFDGAQGEIDFEAPADGILGFEHVAKTATEKQTEASALNILKTKAAEIFLLPAAAGCKLTPKEVDVHREGANHAEVHAEYKVACAKAPKGELRLAIGKFFPKTKEVTVQLVAGETQKSATFREDRGALVF